MTTLSEWKAMTHVRSARRKSEVALQGSLSLIRQAQASMERLTGDSDWDAFVQLIQARIDEDQAQIEDLRSRLSSGEYMSADVALKTRHELAILSAKNEAREEAIALPSQIKASTEKSLNKSST